MSGSNAKEAFVLEYIASGRYGAVSVLDADFHDAFHERFGGARKWKAWGASPVPSAMATLRRLYDRRLLRRARVGLRDGEWQPGFPTWVWEYRIPPVVPPPPDDAPAPSPHPSVAT